jgi:hypothetical protein
MEESSESQQSVNSRPLVRPSRPDTEANQTKKRTRVPEPNPPPDPEPPVKRSRWHLPGFLRGILPPKQNDEEPAVPSQTRGRADKVPVTQKMSHGRADKLPVTQKRNHGRQCKAPISKGKQVVSDSAKRRITNHKLNRRNLSPLKFEKRSPSLSPAISGEYDTPDMCMRCEKCLTWLQNCEPGSADKKESPDNISIISDAGSSNINYIRAPVRLQEERRTHGSISPVILQEESHTYSDSRKINYCDYMNYIKGKSRRLRATSDS